MSGKEEEEEEEEGKKAERQPYSRRGIIKIENKLNNKITLI